MRQREHFGNGAGCGVIRAVMVIIVLAGMSGDAAAIPARASKTAKGPVWREESARATPPPAIAARKQRIFAVGVGFEKSGTLAGVALSVVVPGSPASRAGLVPGCVIAEINGESTMGRAGDDCARLIREAFGPVRLKYLDPALKEKILTLEKEWIALPE